MGRFGRAIRYLRPLFRGFTPRNSPLGVFFLPANLTQAIFVHVYDELMAMTRYCADSAGKDAAVPARKGLILRPFSSVSAEPIGQCFFSGSCNFKAYGIHQAERTGGITEAGRRRCQSTVPSFLAFEPGNKGKHCRMNKPLNPHRYVRHWNHDSRRIEAGRHQRRRLRDVPRPARHPDALCEYPVRTQT